MPHNAPASPPDIVDGYIAYYRALVMPISFPAQRLRHALSLPLYYSSGHYARASGLLAHEVRSALRADAETTSPRIRIQIIRGLNRVEISL